MFKRFSFVIAVVLMGAAWIAPVSDSCFASEIPIGLEIGPLYTVGGYSMHANQHIFRGDSAYFYRDVAKCGIDYDWVGADTLYDAGGGLNPDRLRDILGDNNLHAWMRERTFTLHDTTSGYTATLGYTAWRSEYSNNFGESHAIWDPDFFDVGAKGNADDRDPLIVGIWRADRLHDGFIIGRDDGNDTTLPNNWTFLAGNQGYTVFTGH